jgi:hypothetical protein
LEIPFEMPLQAALVGLFEHTQIVLQVSNNSFDIIDSFRFVA